MPAHLLHQDPSLRAAFAARVQGQIASERDAVGQRVAERLAGAPKPLRSVIRWGVQHLWDGQGRQHARHGRQGEQQLTAALRWRLSSDWWVIPDVLISSDGRRVVQIDVVLVGPPGVIVVEVKRWTGAIRSTGDRWARKDGGRWIPCESPTRQNAAHVRELRAWWQAVGLSNQMGSLPVQPVIVLLETAWLRVTNPTMPVFDRPSAVARDVQGRRPTWTPETVAIVARMLAERPSPFHEGIRSPDG